LGQGVVDNGRKSPGMNTLALHPVQVTMRNGFRSSIVTAIAP
jgi:hypothetical protein